MYDWRWTLKNNTSLRCAQPLHARGEQFALFWSDQGKKMWRLKKNSKILIPSDQRRICGDDDWSASGLKTAENGSKWFSLFERECWPINRSAHSFLRPFLIIIIPKWYFLRENQKLTQEVRKQICFSSSPHLIYSTLFDQAEKIKIALSLPHTFSKMHADYGYFPLPFLLLFRFHSFFVQCSFIESFIICTAYICFDICRYVTSGTCGIRAYLDAFSF